MKGEELKALKEQERILTFIIGEDERLEATAIATPVGDDGPSVAMQLADKWMIGDLGYLRDDIRLSVKWIMCSRLARNSRRCA